MSATRVIVVGASAGGVDSLRRLVSQLPPDLPAAMAIVLHLSPTARSRLPQILDRAGPLPAAQAQDGDFLEDGRIYVAPPDHHLVVEGDRFRLDHGATVNGVRPAVDALFRSAALSYGPCALGVVLSGTLDDGTAGLQAIKEHGGRALVQHPDDASHRDMPASALQHVTVDAVATASDLPKHLSELMAADACRGRADGPRAPGDGLPGEVRPAILACPECGGPLEEEGDQAYLRLRCHVGHEWTELTFEEAQGRWLERALYVALRVLDERAELYRRLEGRAEATQPHLARRWRAKLAEAEAQGRLLRAALRRDPREGDEPAVV